MKAAKCKGAASDACFSFTGKRFCAHGRQTKDGFVVLAGSKFGPMNRSFLNSLYGLVRQKCSDSLTEDGELVQDMTFNSPSQAACVVAGAIVSGRSAWKTLFNGNEVTFQDFYPKSDAEDEKVDAERKARAEMKSQGVDVYEWQDENWHTEWRGRLPFRVEGAKRVCV